MYNRYVNVSSWEQVIKQFIKDALPKKVIHEEGKTLKIEYPERKMYVKITFDGGMTASAYFTDVDKSEFEQDYMLYAEQHIDAHLPVLDEIETAKARGRSGGR